MEDTETVLNFDIGDVDMDNRLSVKISDIRINGTLYHINQQTGRRSSAAVGEGSELIGPSYEVVYTPYSNFFTENSSTYQRFNVVITDLSIGGISFTREIAFPVLPENDPPDLICNTQSIILPPDFLTGSADRFSFNLMATDVDDNSLAYVLQETPSIGEFRDNSGLPIKQNDTFLSTNLTYHSTKSGGIYPFPKFTVYVVDSHSATSKPCTYEFTIDCPPGKYNNIFSNASGPICDTCPDGAICR
ncbi:hypothetical protein BKA69DRAFT_891115 [Paraphysoderma sedebokerense]|nr:hypothetical protein BKA69DRAFT_891115 [Paraphysoderma sedebokerense]